MNAAIGRGPLDYRKLSVRGGSTDYRIFHRNWLTNPHTGASSKPDERSMKNSYVNPVAVSMSNGAQEHQGPYESSFSYGCCDTLSDDLCFLAASPKMLLIRQQILKIASVEAPVFIRGESGVGKETVARLLHLRSTRRQHPFVKVNCAALPEELLESMLFGYEQGAFTGAMRAQPGQFELANKGTIFLDEIAAMSPHLQAKLLHVLQDRQYARLGSGETFDLDARVIAATNVDVEEAIKSGTLRGDLYYRLSAFSIDVPALCERATEIPMMFRHFHRKYSAEFKRETAAPSEGMLRAAMRYTWPDNLSELENFAKRYFILGDDEASIRELHELTALRQRSVLSGLAASACAQGLKVFVRRLRDAVEAQLIAAALTKTHWKRKEAAQVLSISYSALLNRVRRMGLGRRRTFWKSAREFQKMTQRARGSHT